MLFSQITKTIGLPTGQRVHKLIAIDYSTLLISTQSSLLFYSIGEDRIVGSVDVCNWYHGVGWKGQAEGSGSQQSKIKGGDVGIMDLYYHQSHRAISILLSTDNRYKHQAWQLLLTKVEQKDSQNKELSLSHAIILHDYQNNLTKYQQMQLRPKLIIFDKSGYFVLLRQFYNDSLVTVFKFEETATQSNSQIKSNGQKQIVQEQKKDVSMVGSFFVNQENMAQFDQTYYLVSFRSIFKHKIIFEIFSIKAHNQISQKQFKKNSQKHQINLPKMGVIVAIKKIPHSQINQNQNSTQDQQQQGSLNFEAVLCINWRNMSISYLIYSSKMKSLKYKIEQFAQIPRTLFLRFLALTNDRICSVQQKSQASYIVQQHFRHQKPEQIKAVLNPHQDYQQQDYALQQMQCYKLGQQLVIVNYSQSTQKEQSLIFRMYRNVTRSEAVLCIAKEIGVPEGLFPGILQLMVQ